MLVIVPTVERLVVRKVVIVVQSLQIELPPVVALAMLKLFP